MNQDLLKAALCKIDGFVGTVCEMMQEENLSEDDKADLQTIVDASSSIEAKLMADYKRTTGDEEADFMQSTDFYDPEDFTMDQFPEYMDPDDNLEDVIIGEE